MQSKMSALHDNKLLRAAVITIIVFSALVIGAKPTTCPHPVCAR